MHSCVLFMFSCNVTAEYYLRPLSQTEIEPGEPQSAGTASAFETRCEFGDFGSIAVGKGVGGGERERLVFIVSFYSFI